MSSVQTGRNRMNLLVSEYVGDILLTHNNHNINIKSRKKLLWKLVEKLEYLDQNLLMKFTKKKLKIKTNRSSLAAADNEQRRRELLVE